MWARRVLDLDFDAIAGWFRAHEVSMPERSLFPPTGFIIDGIAAGFLYRTDSNVAIIDCYVSNPSVDSKTRSNALNTITEELVGFAKRTGSTVVKCDSKIEAIKKRALDSGFESIGLFEVFVKIL